MIQSIRRSAIVSHAPAKLFAIVEDIERYPTFLPWCLGARVLERAQAGTTATLDVGYRGIRRSFTTRNVSRPPEAIEIGLVEGPFRQFRARWTFAGLGDGAARIEYAMEYEFESLAIGTLLGPLFGHVADTMVDAFSRRADELEGRDAG